MNLEERSGGETKKIEPETESMVLGLYEQFGGNPYEAAESSKLEFSLVESIWRKYKKPFMFNGISLARYRLPLEQIYGFLHHYKICGNVSEACTKANFVVDLCVARDILRRYRIVGDKEKGKWRVDGLYGTHLSKEEIRDIVKQLECNDNITYNGRIKISVIAGKTKHLEETIKKLIKNAGIIIDPIGGITIPRELRDLLLK